MRETSAVASASGLEAEERRGSTAWLFVAGAVTTALAVHTAVSIGVGASRVATLLPIAAAAGLVLAVLALTNVEAFILVVLAARTTLDALKLGSGTQVADPAAAMGLLLLGAVPLWLILQHRSGAMRFRMTLTGTAVAAFTGAALLGVVVSPSMLASGIEWSRIATAAVMFFAVEQIAMHKTKFRWSTMAAAFLALPVPLMFAASQLATGSGLFEAGGFSRITGSFTHSNPFAAYLSLVVIMAIAVAIKLRGARRWLSLAVVAAAAPLLILTYTRGAWIATGVGVVVVALVLRKPAIVAALLAAVVLVAVLVPSVSDRFGDIAGEAGSASSVAPAEDAAGGAEREGSFAWRLGYWEQVLTFSEESPFVGVGLKQIAVTLAEEKQPHNDYLRAYVELGVVGLLAFVLMAVRFLVIGPRAASLLRKQPPGNDRDVGLALVAGFSGVAVAYVVMSITANLMSQTVVLLYVMALAGLASAILVGARQGPPAAASEAAAR